MNTLNITLEDLIAYVEEIATGWDFEIEATDSLVEPCVDYGMFDGDCVQGGPAVVYVDDVKVIENYEIIQEITLPIS